MAQTTKETKMRKTLQLKTNSANVKITIDVSSNKTLLKDEEKLLLNSLTDSVQEIMPKAPYMNSFIHKVKVK